MFDFIEKIGKNSNKKQFWKKVSSFKQKQLGGKTKIDINMNILEKHFKSIFSEEESVNNEFQTNIVNQVNNYETSILNEKLNIEMDVFTIHDVELAIKETKNSKAIGLDEICPYWLKKCNGVKLMESIRKLMNLIYKYKIFPETFNQSKIKPILKDFGKSSKDLNNIRPITISNSLAQLFERLILNKNYNNLTTSDNQFGFKRNSSCKLALFCIRETIINYMEKNSTCYMISLDAEKAFDKLWRPGIYFKLMNRVNKQDWLILKHYYEKSEACIENNEIISNLFKVKNGVKQGGILSPFLFNIFIDDLIKSCLEQNLGGKIFDINTSVISFCDDLNLLSTTIKQAQELLDICSEYGVKWKLKFNPNKSKVIEFGKRIFKSLNLQINKMKIDRVSEMKILGYWFNESMNNNDYLVRNFVAVRKAFFGLNMFGMKPNGLNPFLQAFLYNTFCLSKTTYSIELMNINKKTINMLNVMQNGLIRYMLKLHKSCQMSNILKSLKILNINHLICKYKINFVRQLDKHSLCKQIYAKISNISMNKKSNSFMTDIKIIANTLKCNIEEVGKTKFKIMQLLRIDEIYSKSNDDFDRVKFCLDNINDLEIKKTLILLTNSFERNSIENLIDLEYPILSN
jgi:hypothetical protein